MLFWSKTNCTAHFVSTCINIHHHDYAVRCGAREWPQNGRKSGCWCDFSSYKFRKGTLCRFAARSAQLAPWSPQRGRTTTLPTFREENSGARREICLTAMIDVFWRSLLAIVLAICFGWSSERTKRRRTGWEPLLYCRSICAILACTKAYVFFVLTGETYHRWSMNSASGGSTLTHCYMSGCFAQGVRCGQWQQQTHDPGRLPIFKK